MENGQVCTQCILDTTVKDIWFDENGVCKYCYIHNEMEKDHPIGEGGKKILDQIATQIKNDGKGKDFDCIVGISGGRDSTYTLYMTKKLGLRPLAVHFDNGWNSNIGVSNIKKATKKLGIPLHTVVADWEEFKDLQLAFLKASVSDAEVPTDYVIYSVLWKVASEIGVKYVIEGHSFRTEGTSPISWSYMDGRYIMNVHKKFGTKKIKSFPIMSLLKFMYYIFIKRIRFVRILEYLDYNRDRASDFLSNELGWEYYEGHHHESIYTEFVQSYLLPQKFNIDKRKTEYSALIRSDQMDRKTAIEEVNKTQYPYDKEVVDYTIKKLELSKDEFEEIFNKEIKTFQDYPSYFPIIKLLKWPIKIAGKLGLVPHILYLKYAK